MRKKSSTPSKWRFHQFREEPDWSMARTTNGSKSESRKIHTCGMAGHTGDFTVPPPIFMIFHIAGQNSPFTIFQFNTIIY